MTAPKGPVSRDSTGSPGSISRTATGRTGREDMNIDHPTIVTARKADVTRV